MIAIDLPQARRLAFMCVRAQVVVTVLVAAVSLVVAGPRAAWSAVVGGGASTLGSLAMALLAFGRLSGAGAERMLLAFYVGEIAKVMAVIVVLVLALVFMKVNPVAMISAFMATFLVYWVVLARFLGTKGPVGDAPREMV